MSRSCTMKGNTLSISGPELKVGDAAPDATLKSSLVDDFKLSQAAGRARIYSVVPSLDTPVCAEQTKRFNQEIAGLPNVDFYTISTDLPVAMSRFCGAEGIDTDKFKALSDHMNVSFGKAYGTLLPDLRIEARAVFVIGKDDKIKFVEYVPEITNQPNYEEILACAKEISS